MSRRIGQILLDRGLVKPAALQKALAQQKRTGERLGPILATMGVCTQREIDLAWADTIVRPGLEAAIDRACFNSFTRFEDRSVDFARLERVTTGVEDMLDGAKTSEKPRRIEGSATISMLGARSLPLEFVMDEATGFCELDDNSDAIVRRWVGLMDRKGAGQSGTNTPGSGAGLGAGAAADRIAQLLAASKKKAA